jgi:hydroxysqualene synthase
MMSGTVYEPGEKTHRDENFPVASHLIAPRHRAPILAFYRFARAADDVADHPSLTEEEKIDTLNRFEETLLGDRDAIADAIPLRNAVAEYNLTPQHAQDLLTAFRMDASKTRYDDWAGLMHYCRYSASPVGRFVLDVHGESRETWTQSDELCSALQVNNHLQDCGADYRRLDRVYIPLDVLRRHGTTVEALAADKASPELLRAIRELAHKTQALLDDGRLSGVIRDLRLSLEVAVIERLAYKITGFLTKRDPLSEPVHVGKAGAAATAMTAIALGLIRRLGAQPRRAQRINTESGLPGLRKE